MAAYTVTELEPLGGAWSVALGLNDASAVVGFSIRQDGIVHACLWPSGSAPVDLGAPWNGPAQAPKSSTGSAINSKGKVVGRIYGDQSEHALLYDGSASDLTNLVGNPDSVLYDINNNDVAVGISGDVVGASSGLGGFVLDLKVGVTTTIGGEAWPSAINDQGQVVGALFPPDSLTQPFLYSAGEMKALAPDGGATDINIHGQVVGYSGSTPFVTGPSGSGLTLLDGVVGAARAINDSGTVVGESSSPQKFAWVYTKEAGLVDLNTSIPSGSGWILDVAMDVNNGGAIVGTGLLNGHARGFLLTPVDVSTGPVGGGGAQLKVPRRHANYMSIDPLALILPGRIYQLIRLPYPHPPTIGGLGVVLRRVAKSMTPEERKAAVARAQYLVDYSRAAEKELLGGR